MLLCNKMTVCARWVNTCSLPSNANRVPYASGDSLETRRLFGLTPPDISTLAGIYFREASIGGNTVTLQDGIPSSMRIVLSVVFHVSNITISIRAWYYIVAGTINYTAHAIDELAVKLGWRISYLCRCRRKTFVHLPQTPLISLLMKAVTGRKECSPLTFPRKNHKMPRESFQNKQTVKVVK